jgi:protein TonB
MTMARHMEDNAGPLLRWTTCLLVVGAVHFAALIVARTTSSDHGTPAAPPAVLLDLAPAPQAPAEPGPAPRDVAPPELAPELKQPPDLAPQLLDLPLPEPPPPVEIPETLPPSEVALPKPPPSPLPPPRPRPVRRPPPERTTPSRPAAPVQHAAPAPRQAAPVPGSVPATWQDALRAHLARFKRYPVQAQRRGVQGVVVVRFAMNRAGMVLSVAVARSSGHRALDEEARRWIERAQPLPKPPREVTSDPVELVIPLRFALH